MQRALFYAKHIDRFAPPNHNLFVFQVRTNKAPDQGLLGSRCPNSRQLRHSCSSLAAVLLTCLKILLKLILLFLLLHSWNMYYYPISTILKPMALEQDASSHSEKRLRHLVHCKQSRIVLKTGQEKCILQLSVSLAAVSPTPTFGHVWESCSQVF